MVVGIGCIGAAVMTGGAATPVVAPVANAIGVVMGEAAVVSTVGGAALGAATVGTAAGTAAASTVAATTVVPTLATAASLGTSTLIASGSSAATIAVTGSLTPLVATTAGTAAGAAVTAGGAAVTSGAASTAYAAGTSAVLFGNPLGLIVLGAETNHTSSAIMSSDNLSWDCWKPILQEESTVASLGMPLNDILLHPDVTVEVVEIDSPAEFLIQVSNKWGTRFRIEPVHLPSGALAAHATRV
jgi:hypothetical protein